MKHRPCAPISLAPVIASLLLFAINVSPAFPILRDTLACGLPVLTSEDHSVPMVGLRLVVLSGGTADPAGQEGLANLTAAMLQRGTLTRSATRLNEEIEFVGGRLGIGVDYDHTFINIRVLSEHLDLALDLLSDMVLHPAFRDSELTRARREIRGEIRRQQDDPGTILGQVFCRELFGASPYAHPVIGDSLSVARLTRQQVVDFYQRWFRPNNCYLVGVGDFAAGELERKLAARFSGWTRGPVPALAVSAPAPIPRPRGIVINRPDMNQAYILLGHNGIREGAPDVFRCRVMNYMLGGSGLNSRIAGAVREKRGLAYDARSYFDRRRSAGAFVASTETRTDSASAAIGIILSELRRMRAKGTDADELRRAKDYFLGSFPLDYESFNDRISALDRIELFNLGLDYLDEFAGNIETVTAADVLKAAQEHVFPGNFLLVVIGNLTEKDITVPGIEWSK
jgi:zinc protease